MGISQLLPFLGKITERVTVSQFEGWTVAIDAYCWLHKGSYACSEQLLLGTPTDQYVSYCMKFIDMLLRHKIKPVMVFDGQKLESKAKTEEDRGLRRRAAANTARRLLLDGNRIEAKRYLGQAISVTSKMAHEVIEACRAKGIDCIVAQYEADAQLAYLNLSGIVNLVISEDSDLLVFGCQRVLFKLDISGHGELVESNRLGEILGNDFTFEKFRFMCILSGCDYLDGVDGIGLAKALKVFRRAKQTDVRRILQNISGYLGSKVTLRKDYIEDFVTANNTFQYQLVYDPVERCVKPLTPRPKNLTAADFPNAGKELSPQIAYNLAIGNLDPMNLKPFEGYATWQPKTNDRSSIWCPNYEIPKNAQRKLPGSNVQLTTGSVVTASATKAVLASWGGSQSTSTMVSQTTVAISSVDRKRKFEKSETLLISERQSFPMKSKLDVSETKNVKSRRLDFSEVNQESVAIVVEDSDPEENALEVVSTQPIMPSSPAIISQSARRIQRNMTSSLPANMRNSSQSDLFETITPPCSLRSADELLETSQNANGYFLPKRSSQKSPVIKPSRPSLAARLASQRFNHIQQNSLTPSPTPTPVDDPALSEENTPPEIILINSKTDADVSTNNGSLAGTKSSAVTLLLRKFQYKQE